MSNPTEDIPTMSTPTEDIPTMSTPTEDMPTMSTPTEDMPTVSSSTEEMPTVSSSTEELSSSTPPSAQHALEQRIARLESAAGSQKKLYKKISSTITRLEDEIAGQAYLAMDDLREESVMIMNENLDTTITRIEDQISSQTYEAINNVLSETFNIFAENRDIEKDIHEKKAALARNFEILEARQQVVSTWEQQLKERGAKLDEREQKLALREHDVRRGEEALKAESVRARRYKEELKKTVIELQNGKGRDAWRVSEETEEERTRLLDVAMELVKKEREAELQSEHEAERRALYDARRAVEETLKRQGQERSQFWGLRKRKADDME